MKALSTRRKRSPSTTSNANAAGVVTLEMVAQAAGVSPSTVSRILNGTASVSLDKKHAVDAAIKKLDFEDRIFKRPFPFPMAPPTRQNTAPDALESAIGGS